MSSFAPGGPPGLPAARTLVPYGDRLPLSNRLAWCLALTPLAWLAWEAVLGGTNLEASTYRSWRFPVLFILNSILIQGDALRLCRADIRLGRLALLGVLVPVYLALRAVRVGRGWGMVVVWSLLFALTFSQVRLIERTIGVRVKGELVASWVTARLNQSERLNGTGTEGNVVVTCPPHPRVRVGRPFRCAVTGFPGSTDVVVTVTTLDGRFRWSLALPY